MRHKKTILEWASSAPGTGMWIHKRYPDSSWQLASTDNMCCFYEGCDYVVDNNRAANNKQISDNLYKLKGKKYYE